MTTQFYSRTKTAAKPRSSVYDVITSRIIAKLEQGTVPWRKPWKTIDGPQQNLISRQAYRGVNVFLTAMAGYSSPYWLTFKQAQQLGGNVRKGEKATPVVFWKQLDVPDNGDEADDEPTTRKIPLLRYYSVFNVAQCDLPADKIPQPATQPRTIDSIDRCEQIVDAMPSRPEIRHGMDQAAYSPALDRVGMPDRNSFDGSAEYYSALFHELTHSTGHSSRLNRKGIVGPISFGSQTYSEEELIAEMGASFLSGEAGIENATLDNSAAYIAGWLARLKSDNRLIVHAGSAAQKAADFILGRNAG